MRVISLEISVPLPTFVVFYSLEHLKYFYKTILYLPNLDSHLATLYLKYGMCTQTIYPLGPNILD